MNETMNGQAGPEEVDTSEKKNGLKAYAQESVLTVPRDSSGRVSLNLQDRLLLLDLFRRSGMDAKQFGRIVGLSKQCLLRWNERFEEEGPAGLEDRPKGIKRGSRLSEHVQTAILMMKQANPSWGVDRIHQMLLRSDGCYASPGAITKLLKENGYEAIPLPTKRHPDKPRRFERARPGSLWQTDLFTFILKRQNRRVHLVAFMDDHSRFIVSHHLSASSSGDMVREALEEGIASFGPPEEVLTDQGPQYHTWRGKSAFRRLLDRRGIRQVVARARHPQTLGKVERFWKTLWAECLESAIFVDLEDARERIAHFVGWYNFQRTHQGIDGLVPADRFFDSADEVRKVMEARVAANALEIAQHGKPRKAFYLTGRVGDESISLHAEGERVVLTKEDGSRSEVDLSAPGRREPPLKCPPGPGSPVDEGECPLVAPAPFEAPAASCEPPEVTEVVLDDLGLPELIGPSDFDDLASLDESGDLDEPDDLDVFATEGEGR